MTFPRNIVTALLTVAVIFAFGSCPDRPPEPVTPPEPEVNWDEVPVIGAAAEPPTYNPLDDMPDGYGADAGEVVDFSEPLPPMPPAADLGPPEPEEGETAYEMHMREAMEARRPGWCSTFCSRIGGRQLHPDAFRRRLRGDFIMEAEMDSREFMGEDDPDESYEDMAERVAQDVEARFGDQPICACENDSGVLGQHWVMAVPRERAVFFHGSFF